VKIREVRVRAADWDCEDEVGMRLWHLVVGIIAIAMVLAIVRDPIGRVAFIVFCTALGEVIIGTSTVLALFQTIGALGEAKGLFAHAEATASTAIVLVVGSTLMSSWLFAGAWLVQVTVP
jgi:membrane associated rhomboid family serine protease